MQERVVASIGIRGGYSKESFEENSKKLIDWVRNQPDGRLRGTLCGVLEQPFYDLVS